MENAIIEQAATQAPVPQIIREEYSDYAKNTWDYSAGYVEGEIIESSDNIDVFSNLRWFAGPCLFTQTALDACVFRHEKTQINVSGNVLRVTRFMHCNAWGLTGEMPCTYVPGMVAIIDYSRPFSGVKSPTIAQTATFSHEGISFDPGKHPSLSALGPETTIGRVINSELDFCFKILLSGREDLPPSRIKRLMSCIQVAFSGGRTQADIRAEAREALGDVIKKYIEKHLRHPDLTTTTLLREFAVSRATLYRIFEPYGGVRAYIAERKLMNAVLQISRNPARRRRITEISEAWGYTSYLTFNRAVRRSFGVSPNSLFQSSAGAEHEELYQRPVEESFRLPEKNKWVAPGRALSFEAQAA